MAEQVDQFASFRRNFDNYVTNYVSNSRSQEFICKDTATRILRILRGASNVSLPQLKYYVKQKNIQLRDFPDLHLQGVLCLPNDNNSNYRKLNHKSNSDGIFGKYRRIAVKEEFFDIINEIHTQKGSGEHLGPRKTFREISRHHAYVSREIVFSFVKMCPTCSSLYNDHGRPSISGDFVTLSHLEREDGEADFKPLMEKIRHPLDTSGRNKSPDFPTSTMLLDCKKEPETTSPSLSIPLLPHSAATADQNESEEMIMDADHFMAIGQVRIIDIQELLNLSSPPRHYSCLVHYIDLWSKYSILWPLKIRDIDELASGIAKNVFAYFGSPKQIIYDTDFDEAQRLEESLRKWSKQVKVTIGLQEPLASSGPVHWKIVDKLKELLAESWEDQLSKLQYISNTKLVANHQHVSPYKAVLGKEPIAETFADLADRHNTFGSSSSRIGTVPKSVSTDPNVDSLNNLSYSLIPNPVAVISDICQINLNETDSNDLDPDQTEAATTVNSVKRNTNTTSPPLDKTASHNLGDNCLDSSLNEVPLYQMFHGFVPTTSDVCQIDLTEKESAVASTLPTFSQSSINHLNPVPIACTINRAAIAANKSQTMTSAIDQSTNHNFAPHSLLRPQQLYPNESFTSEAASLHTLATSPYASNNATLSSLSGLTNVTMDDFQLSLVNFGGSSPGDTFGYTNVLGEDARLRHTAAERQARHRNKLRECGDYENYKKAHAEQQRKMRNRRKEREKLLPEAEQLRLLRERREKTKKRVARWRALQKQKFERQLSQQANSSTQNLAACKIEPIT